MSARKVYPPDFEDFVRVHCWQRTDVELTAIVNEHYGTSYTRKQLRYYRYNHHCYNGLSSCNYEPRRKYTPELVEFVRANAAGRSRKEIIEMVEKALGVKISINGLKSIFTSYGISTGNDGRFKKGNVPHNKGMHQPTRGRASETQFKKGGRPHNWRPVGSVYVRGDGYAWRKIAEPNVIREEHRCVWEEHYGPIPDGMNVMFLDGDRRNCSIENLTLVSKQENVVMNKKGLRSEDPEATRAGITAAKLTIAIAGMKKKAAAGQKGDEHGEL